MALIICVSVCLSFSRSFSSFPCPHAVTLPQRVFPIHPNDTVRNSDYETSNDGIIGE